MFTTQFGIEIEMTGVTRAKAAKAIGDYLVGRVDYRGGSYGEYHITNEEDGRVWKVMYDGSIHCQKKQGGQTVNASQEHSVELVSPILTYEQDKVNFCEAKRENALGCIEDLQEIVRVLRKAGAFTNKGCGIHIHCDGAGHTPQTVRNFICIVVSKD